LVEEGIPHLETRDFGNLSKDGSKGGLNEPVQIFDGMLGVCSILNRVSTSQGKGNKST
jgi:hypothetical protein